MASLQVEVERILGRRAVVAGAELARYATDESGLGPYPPDVVALVETRQEIRELLRFAALDRVAVTPRGLGTGKTGGALAVNGGIVLSTERMRAIREIDERDLVAVVEPGVVTAELQRQVEGRGLFYPPDPGSAESCSLGGNVAENAGGPRAFKYGTTRDYVRALEVSLIGGEQLRLGTRSHKGVTGLDVLGLMVGSEGTLGVISEVVVRLLPRPAATAAFAACFADAFVAGAAVAAMAGGGHRPRAIELLDPVVLEHLRAEGAGWPVGEPGQAMLLVEIDGTAAETEGRALAAAAACERAGARQLTMALDGAQQRRLWEMRRKVSEVLRKAHPHKVSEDVAVPLSAIPTLLQRLDGLAAEHGVTIAAYGHAGDGNLHVNVLVDEKERLLELDPLLTEIFRHALSLGGTLTGEHGVGLAKRRFMTLEQPPALLALQRELKRVFDPDGLMNPGKVLP